MSTQQKFVTVKAEANVLGLGVGTRAAIPRTEIIDNHIAAGLLTVVDDDPELVDADTVAEPDPVVVPIAPDNSDVKAVWAAYADSVGAVYPSDATKAQIQEAAAAAQLGGIPPADPDAGRLAPPVHAGETLTDSPGPDAR